MSAPSLKFELLDSENYSAFLLRDAKEISFVLRQLMQKRAMITAYFGETKRFMLTSIAALSEDGKYLFLDTAAHPSDNEQAAQAQNLLCITQVDKVKVQFRIQQLETAQYKGYTCFRVPMPQEILRLQRREYFRLTTEPSHPLLCQIPLEEQAKSVQAQVLDISGGGVAVIVPPQGLKFQAMTEFQNCHLDLPDFGSIQAGLRVCNLFRISQQNGVDVLRAGCQFVGLTSAMSSTIQRYILRVERDSRTRNT